MNAQSLMRIPAESYVRDRFLGGSDIAGVIGLSDFGDTPLSVYLRKRKEPGLQPPQFEKPYFKRGKLWEKVVGEMLVDELTKRGYRVNKLANNERYSDADHAFLAAEIDYELQIEGFDHTVNCELKTVTPFVASRWPQSDVEDMAPVGYTAQVLHGLGITRRPFGILAALFGADELRVYPVRYAQDIVDAMRADAVTLWHDHILAGVPPEPRTLADVERRYKEGNGQSLIADDELVEKALQLRALYAEIDKSTTRAEVLEFQIKRAMGECEHLTVAGENAVNWKNRKFSILEQEALKEAHPAIHKQFVRTGTTRAFSVLKGFKVPNSVCMEKFK